MGVETQFPPQPFTVNHPGYCKLMATMLLQRWEEAKAPSRNACRSSLRGGKRITNASFRQQFTKKQNTCVLVHRHHCRCRTKKKHSIRVFTLAGHAGIVLGRLYSSKYGNFCCLGCFLKIWQKIFPSILERCGQWFSTNHSPCIIIFPPVSFVKKGFRLATVSNGTS